jgi:hypothetical protein
MKRLLLIAALLGGCTDTKYDYDNTSAGSPEGTKVPRDKTSSQFVRSVYSDLVGRTPESYDFTLKVNGVQQFKFQLDEEAQLVTTLDGIGDGLPMRNLIANGLLHSDEVTIPAKGDVADPTTFIHDQFTKLLGREPNPYELAVFVDAWNTDPAVGPRTIIRAIVGSREYQSQ